MRFLGDELTITTAADWNHAGKAKLFLYNVHYFDDLNAVDAQERLALHSALIERWIVDNPAPLGNGWESYPLSLRIVNWIAHFSRRDTVPQHWLDSLATQALYLSKRIEYHLLGNHLFTNAKALVFAGCFLENNDRLLSTGLAILQRELPEQVLSDGGHFELSPMYHCIAMADLIDLVNLANSYPDKIPSDTRQDWKRTLKLMFRWLDHMQHPDARISLFNDAAFGIAPDRQTLAAYAKTQAIEFDEGTEPIHYAEASGYVAVHSTSLTCMMDVGRIGPDYIPGHAHADSLTFELSLHGQRVVCDSGTSVYGTGAERLRQRGTNAHNTVVVDSENSSEVWSGFRVARRAYPLNVSVKPPLVDSQNTAISKHESDSYTRSIEGLVVSAGHTGYRRLPGQCTHHRQWSFGDGKITINDKVSGNFNEAIALYHLHPDVLAEQNDSGVLLILANKQSARFTAHGGSIRIEPSTWHPEFGVSVPSQRLVVTFTHNELTTTLAWREPMIQQ